MKISTSLERFWAEDKNKAHDGKHALEQRKSTFYSILYSSFPFYPYRVIHSVIVWSSKTIFSFYFLFLFLYLSFYLCRDAALGELLGKYFVNMSFSGQSEDLAVTILHTIEAAMKEDILDINWMDNTTRSRALDKLALVSNMIG